MSFLFLAQLVLLAAQPDAAPARKAGLDPERLGRIQPRMQQFVDQGALPGVVTLVARKGYVHSTAVGFRDLEARKPMTTDSIFQVMSMTKPFTGVGIMMLVEEGKLALADPVKKYLPEFGALRGGRPITVHDLMTHTSGLPSMPSGEFKDLYQRMDRTLAEAVAASAKQLLEFEPGSKWSYCNMGIATLGGIIEVISGKPFEAFIEQRIFAPLAMKDSHFFLPPSKRDRLAIVYKHSNGKLTPEGGDLLGGNPRRFREGAKYPAPEFGLYSTVADLSHFYQMMLNKGVWNGKRLLSPASVDTMTSVHTGNLKAGHMPGTAFGLTWEVVKEPLGEQALLSVGTFGHGGAFGTHGWVDRKKDLVGVYLVQGSGITTDGKYAFMALASAAVID